MNSLNQVPRRPWAERSSYCPSNCRVDNRVHLDLRVALPPFFLSTLDEEQSERKCSSLQEMAGSTLCGTALSTCFSAAVNYSLALGWGRCA